MKPKKRPPFDFGAPEPPPEGEATRAFDPPSAEEFAAFEAEAAESEPTPVEAPDASPDLDFEIESPEPSRPAFSAPRRERDLEPLFDPGVGAAPAPFGSATPARAGSRAAAIVDPSPVPVYAGAAVVSALWALAPIAYAVGYRQGVTPLQNDVFALTVFGLLALGPMVLVWVAAFLLNQGRRLAAETRRARALADEMIGPAALAAGGAQEAVAAIRAEIEHASSMAAQARDKMLALREAVSVESERLADAAAASGDTARKLAKALAQERGAMGDLAGQLDGQSAAIADAIGRQAKMVAEASDLAETQLREAEAALAARAADLAAAAGEASDAARIGSEDLARQIARLETAGVGVSEQIRIVDEGLTEQRAALVSVAHALRAGQEDFAVQSESQVAQLSEFLGHAKLSASDLGDVARRSAEAISDLTAATSQQFREMAEAARDEREALAEQVAYGFSRIGDAAAVQRQALEAELTRALAALTQAGDQARQSAEHHADAVQTRVDRLGEAAFTAGQKADAVFEARLTDARNLIETSAQMVEQAAAGAAQRLEAGVEAARAAVGELERLLAAVSDKVVEMPVEAQAKAAEVKAAVEKGVDELMAHARRAADETQAIDQAFQDRVRRNYDMLSEAARMMGHVAGSTPVNTGGGLAAAASRLSAATALPPSLTPTPASPAAPPPAAEAPAGGFGDARPRLRLRPTATDSEFSAVFDAAGGKAPPAPSQPTGPLPEGEGLTWRDLLTTLDDAGAGLDERLAERLAGEIGGMGIDPAALLPKGRIEEIAAAVQTRDLAGARTVVKGLAPAAVRRLVRRLFSDAALREDAERFRRRYGGMLDEAAEQDREGFLVSALLASEAGRTYLLLETAAGDLA